MIKKLLSPITFILLIPTIIMFFQVNVFALEKDYETSSSYKVTALVSSAVDTIPPSAPKNLEAVNKTYTSISLKWAPALDNTGVRGYELYRDGKKILTTKKTSYTSTSLIPGRNYTYSIKAYDAAGNVSAAGTSLTVSTIKDTQSPSMPRNLLITSVTHTTSELSWEPSSDNTGIKGYEIYCNERKIAVTSATGYVCKKLTPGTRYSFSLKAIDISGNYSSQSNYCFTDTIADITAPSVPNGLKVSTVSSTEINLMWSPSSDNVKVKGYEIFCDGKSVGSTSKTNLKNSNLIPGRSYLYTIRAIDESNNISNKSVQLKVQTLNDMEPPKAPIGLSVSSSTKSSATLKWQASTDDIKIKGYYIYCNGIKVGSTTRTSYTVKGLGNAGLVIFSVKAYDLADNMSENCKGVIQVFVK
jgi:chitodextrinase